MMKRFRLLPLLAAILALILLAGCGGAKEEVKPAAAPAPAAQTCPECPKLDKPAAVYEAAQQFLATMPATYHQIDSKDLKKKMDAKDTTLYLVDIRKAEDFEKQWVEGFVNIPFLSLGTSFDKLPKDKQIIVSCYTGQTAGQATAALRMAGFNVLTVKFGWKGIEDSGVFEIKKK